MKEATGYRNRPNTYRRHEYDQVEPFSIEKMNLTHGGKVTREQGRKLGFPHSLCQNSFLVQGCTGTSIHPADKRQLCTSFSSSVLSKITQIACN